MVLRRRCHWLSWHFCDAVFCTGKGKKGKGKGWEGFGLGKPRPCEWLVRRIGSSIYRFNLPVPESRPSESSKIVKDSQG